MSSTLRGFGFGPRQGSHSISWWLSEAPPPEPRNRSTHFGKDQKRLIPGYWPNGLSLHDPPVSTPGPIPGVFGNYDLANQLQMRASSGFTGYPGFGVYVPLGRRLPPPPQPP